MLIQLKHEAADELTQQNIGKKLQIILGKTNVSSSVIRGVIGSSFVIILSSQKEADSIIKRLS